MTRTVLDDSPVGVRFSAGADIFLSITASKAAVGATDHRARFVSGAPSLGVEVSLSARLTALFHLMSR